MENTRVMLFTTNDINSETYTSYPAEGISDNETTQDNLSTFSVLALRITYIVIGFVGFLGNGLVVCIIMTSARMRKGIPNLYLISQSLTDLLASVCIAAIALAGGESEGLSGTHGNLLCKLWLTRFPLWSMLMSSTYNLLALTLERYLRVVHPVAHKNHFTRRKALLSVCVAWSSGPLYNITWKWPTSMVIDGKCHPFSIWPSPLAASMVGVVTILLEFFIPLLLMVLAYTKMISVLKSRVSPRDDNLTMATCEARNQSQQVVKAAGGFRRAKSNIVKTLVMVCVCFVICWVWNSVYIFLYFVGQPTSFTGAFYHFTVVAVFANCCVNPFVYAANYRDFQLSTRSLFCRHAVNIDGDASLARHSQTNT